MYISKLFVNNYRSLKQVVICFDNGKNVIVGKNNSGKSNIIKALDILVGEKFPTYIGFGDNDFYTYKKIDYTTREEKEIIAENFYIEAEIEGRDFDENMILGIKKKTAFSKIKSVNDLYQKNLNDEIEVNFDLFQNLDSIEERAEVETISTTARGIEIKTSWLDSKSLLANLKVARKFKIFFCKSRIDDDSTGFGVIYQDENGEFWISHFMSKKFRSSLITTTVITALRSHKEDLRLTNYTWFGRLIANLWNENKNKIEPKSRKSYEDLIREQSGNIKLLVDSVFEKNTDEIRKLLEHAIAHKSVSFKFLNDSKFDLYRNIQIFVDDGIDRPITEKGTGIQSAIIIALFSQYCNKFHNKSSLLIAEEPELYLHPQARRVISAELNNYIEDSSNSQERQLIICTHSTEYLRNVEPKNIIRIFKDTNDNCSKTAQLEIGVSKEITTEIQRFIWSNNTEMFFADTVILVEGGEVYLIPTLVDLYIKSKQFLDYANTSIARVNGKGSFLTYAKMLDCFKIQWIILGDLDCYQDEVPKICRYLNISTFETEFSKIKTALSSDNTDYKAIKERIDGIDRPNFDAQSLQRVFEKFISGEIEKEDSDLIETINYMRSRFVKARTKDVILNAMSSERFKEIQLELRSKKIFIWSEGALENYFTNTTLQLKGSKDIRPLELSYKLQEDSIVRSDYLLFEDEIDTLCELITNSFKHTEN